MNFLTFIRISNTYLHKLETILTWSKMFPPFPIVLCGVNKGAFTLSGLLVLFAKLSGSSHYKKDVNLIVIPFNQSNLTHIRNCSMFSLQFFDGTGTPPLTMISIWFFQPKNRANFLSNTVFLKKTQNL